MKKIIWLILSIMVVIGVLITIFVFPKYDKEIFINDKENNYLINSNAITMMYETEAGSGEYQVSNDTNWPGEGYIFNERLSGCENGGTLSWNSETNKVIMMSNSSDKCYVYFDKYSSVQITNVVASNITSSSITINVSATSGTNQISKYYYSINNGSSYTESSNSNYTFTGLEKGTKYNIKVYAIDTKNYSSNIYSLSATTKNSILLADYIINEVYESDGVNGLYYHDGVGSYTNANLEAGDNSYRYSGANPNNYVCFGSDAATCPNENLYRIIGVFDEDSDGEYNVKLIKNISIGNYKWDEGDSNEWNKEIKPDIYEILNINFLNTFSIDWQNKIAVYYWQVGGMSNGSSDTTKQYYNSEIKNSIGYKELMKIGLIYVSDYGFSVSPEYWGTRMYDYSSSTNSNWIYDGNDEWTISLFSMTINNAFAMQLNGNISSGKKVSSLCSIRPTFYLLPNAMTYDGNGSLINPYRIN